MEEEEMKKLLVVLCLLLVMAAPVMAEGLKTYTDFNSDGAVVFGLKDLAGGMLWDKTNGRFLLSGTASVLTIAKLVSINIGKASNGATETINRATPWIGGANVNINTACKLAKEKWGWPIEYTLPGDLQIGAGIGRDFAVGYDEGHFWYISGNIFWSLTE